MGRAQQFAVATGHELTTAAVADVLRAGGTAADAIIAGAVMACVCEPVLAGIAGGGALVLREATGPARALDFFCDTPGRKRPADEIDFREIWADFGTTRQSFHIGAGSIATPSFMPGLGELHRRFGRMPWRELMAPAITAARGGVVVTAYQARLMQIIQPIYRDTAPARALYAPQGEMLGRGEVFRPVALGDTLDAVAHEGVRLMTEGEVAAAMASLTEVDGHLTMADMKAYRPEWRTPLMMSRGGATMALNPPPAMGGALAAFSLALMDHRPDAIAIARAFAATQEARVEAALADDPIGGAARLADPALAARYRKMVSERPRSRRGTTHLSVIDAQGMGVAMTLTNGEGCGLIAPGTGIMPNNMLGEADLCPRGFHTWAQGTRLSSNITPGLVAWPDGRLVALGTGGSNRIRTAIAQVLLRLIDHEESIEAAIAAPRLHVEGDALHAEHGAEADIVALRREWPDATFWPEPTMFFGGVHAAMSGPRGALAAGDPRRAGAAVTGPGGG